MCTSLAFRFHEHRSFGLKMFALISKGFEHRSVANVHFVGFQKVSSTSGCCFLKPYNRGWGEVNYCASCVVTTHLTWVHGCRRRRSRWRRRRRRRQWLWRWRRRRWRWRRRRRRRRRWTQVVLLHCLSHRTQCVIATHLAFVASFWRTLWSRLIHILVNALETSQWHIFACGVLPVLMVLKSCIVLWAHQIWESVFLAHACLKPLRLSSAASPNTLSICADCRLESWSHWLDQLVLIVPMLVFLSGFPLVLAFAWDSI